MFLGSTKHLLICDEGFVLLTNNARDFLTMRAADEIETMLENFRLPISAHFHQGRLTLLVRIEKRQPRMDACMVGGP